MREAHDLASLHLGQIPLLDDVCDLGDELGLEQFLFSVGQSEAGEHVARADASEGFAEIGPDLV